MSISFVGSNQTTGWTAGSLGTLSVVIPGGHTNTALLVLPSAFSNAGTLNRSVATVTYGGVGLNFLLRSQGITGNINVTQESWLLLNPTAGTANLVLNFAGSITSGNGGMHVIILDGVKQSGQPDATGKNENDGGTVGTVNITTVADNSWVISMDSCNNNGSVVQDPSQTFFAGDGFTKSSYKGPISPAGLATQKYTDAGASDNNLLQAVSLSPAVVASTSTPFYRNLLGVGQ